MKVVQEADGTFLMANRVRKYYGKNVPQRTVFLVKWIARSPMIHVGNLVFPREFIGKRVRIVIEEIDEKNEVKKVKKANSFNMTIQRGWYESKR